MASKSVNQEIETILEIVRENPNGVGIAELELLATQRLDAPLIRRTLQRRLDLLMADGKILGEGKSVARVYKPVSK